MPLSSPPGRRTATFVVAASNAPASSKAGADYVCTGTSDEVVINAAIAALPTPTLAHGPGGIVELTEGNFWLGGTVTVSGSGVTLRGRGYEATYVSCFGGLGRGVPAIAVNSGNWGYANRLTELQVRGGGGASPSNRTANMDGVRLNGVVRVDRVMVLGVDRGFVLASNGGHESLDQCIATSCFYGLYYWRQSGDQHITTSEFAGNNLSSVACSALTAGISGFLNRVHLGYGPLCFYQEPVAAPSSPLVLGATSGTLPAGDYTVGCTYLLPRQAGDYGETALGSSSATITLAAGSAITVSGFTLPYWVDQAKFYIIVNTAGIANGYVATYAGLGAITLGAAGNGTPAPASTPAATGVFLIDLLCHKVSLESFVNGVAATDVPTASVQGCSFLSCPTANPWQGPWSGFRANYAIEGTPGSFSMNYWRGAPWVGDGALGSFSGGSWWDIEAQDNTANSCCVVTASPGAVPNVRLKNDGAVLDAERRIGTLTLASPPVGALAGGSGLLQATFSSRAHFGPLSTLAPRATPFVSSGQSIPGNLPAGYAFALLPGSMKTTSCYSSNAAAGMLVAAAPLTGWGWRQARPAAPASLVATTGGALAPSTLYSYAYALQGATYGSNNGLSRAGQNASVSLSAAQTAVTLTFPNFTWPAWYTPPTSIVLYRNTVADPHHLYQVATLAFGTYNNGAAPYTDTAADSALGALESGFDGSPGTSLTFTYQPQAIATCPTMGATGQAGATVPLLNFALPSGTKICLGYGTANAEVVTTNAAFYPGASVALTWSGSTVATHAQGDAIVIMPSSALSFSYTLW